MTGARVDHRRRSCSVERALRWGGLSVGGGDGCVAVALIAVGVIVGGASDYAADWWGTVGPRGRLDVVVLLPGRFDRRPVGLVGLHPVLIRLAEGIVGGRVPLAPSREFGACAVSWRTQRVGCFVTEPLEQFVAGAGELGQYRRRSWSVIFCQASSARSAWCASDFGGSAGSGGGLSDSGAPSSWSGWRPGVPAVGPTCSTEPE